MADTKQDENVRRALDAQRAAADESRRQGDEKLSKGRPTPTQEENDRAKLGEHVLEHEDDGSGPDPHADANAEAQARVAGRHVEAERPSASGGTYRTRASAPATPQPSRTTGSS
jgi:hypothetical protein